MFGRYGVLISSSLHAKGRNNAGLSQAPVRSRGANRMSSTTSLLRMNARVGVVGFDGMGLVVRSPLVRF